MDIDTKIKSEGTRLTESPSDLPLFSFKEKEEKSRKKTLLFVVALVIVSVFLMAAIASAVKLNEVTVAGSQLEKEIEKLEKQKKESMWELEKKNDMVYFEQYASSELGMLKGQDSPTDEREDIIE